MFLSSGGGNTDGGKLFLSEFVAGMVGKLMASDVVYAGVHTLSFQMENIENNIKKRGVIILLLIPVRTILPLNIYHFQTCFLI